MINKRSIYWSIQYPRVILRLSMLDKACTSSSHIALVSVSSQSRPDSSSRVYLVYFHTPISVYPLINVFLKSFEMLFSPARDALLSRCYRSLKSLLSCILILFRSNLDSQFIIFRRCRMKKHQDLLVWFGKCALINFVCKSSGPVRLDKFWSKLWIFQSFFCRWYDVLHQISWRTTIACSHLFLNVILL